MSLTERMQTDRQKTPNRSSRIFVVLLFLFALLLAFFLFLNTSYFTIGSIIVDGNKYVSTEEIHRIAGIGESTNIFRLQVDTIQRRLDSDLRLTEVEVSRKLPATIVIRLKERQPLAYVACSYGFVQVDAKGIVLAAFKNLKQVSVPIITGVRLGNVYVGDRIDTEQIKQVLQYLTAVDEQALNQLSEVNIQSNQLVAYTTGSITLRIGNTDRLNEKAKLTTEILQEIQAKQLKVEYVDMNFATPFIKIKH